MKINTPEFRSLFTPELVKLSELFKNNNYEIRIAGGAVRDLLMGITPADVDFASTATPTEMKELFEKKSIRMLNKRGEEHGTITCRIDDKANFEITTLRVDLVCDGRRAEVEYTKDWQLDANRRDLTINSLFLDLDGNVTDYFGGIEDIKKRRVAFVGDAKQRIQEDYLRILRYFRFFGRISNSNQHEDVTINAIIKYKDGLKGVSPERIWTELKKIVVGRMAPEVVTTMLTTCQLSPYLGLPDFCNLERFTKVYENYGKCLEPMTMIACLCTNPIDVDNFHKKTKLSNDERDLGKFIISERDEATINKDDLKWWTKKIADLIVKPGTKMPKGQECVIQLAMSVCAEQNMIQDLKAYETRKFPVNGMKLKEVGVPPGPGMRTVLEDLYKIWRESDFELDEKGLLEHAKEMKDPSPKRYKPNDLVDK